MDLSQAAAWLEETLGYAHADIRPPNILLDKDERLKFTDLDCAAQVGTPSEGSAPPWARVLGSEAGSDAGSFCGARTEQFSTGSVLYYMTRGFEPYENGEQSGPDVVALFRRMEFPPLGSGSLDRVVDSCWKGRFERLRDLADETRNLNLDGHGDFEPVIPFTAQYCLGRRKECQSLVDDGLLEWDLIPEG